MSDQSNSQANQQIQPVQEIDPLEAQLQAEGKEVASDPLDVHAQMFYMYTPRLRSQLNMMNKKALIRLLFSLVQHPLNEKEIKTRSKIEQDAFQTADQMLTSKYVMMIVTDLRTQQEAESKKELDKTAPPVVLSNNDEVKKENE